MRQADVERTAAALVIWAAALIVLATTPPTPDVRVVMDTGQADSLLAILEKKNSGEPIHPADWESLFETAGYQRLAARETAMKRSFTRDQFEKFALSPELASRRQDLSSTLARWKSVDVAAAARKALAYLPPNASIVATVFPVIKPQPNSFVFNQPAPSIFLAIDPSVTPEQLGNKLAHELHHIGFASACPPPAASADTEKLPTAARAAFQWLSAFGEGFAMLAAAGGPEVHPHAVSNPEDRARWDSDMRHVDRDLEKLDRFFRDILEGRLEGERLNERGFSFFGIQGPWYTVGYRMAVTIERASGRDEMIRCFCDARRLPRAYNRALQNLHRGGARWSRRLLKELTAAGTGS